MYKYQTRKCVADIIQMPLNVDQKSDNWTMLLTATQLQPVNLTLDATYCEMATVQPFQCDAVAFDASKRVVYYQHQVQIHAEETEGAVDRPEHERRAVFGEAEGGQWVRS